MRTLILVFFLVLSSMAAMAQEIRPMVGQLRGVVTSGENLLDIAQQHRVAVDHLAFANGFPVTTLAVKPGTKVIVPTWRILPANPPRNGIVINLPERGLFLFRGGQFSGFYPLSIGDEVLDNNRFWTRAGSYHIIEKEKNPTWYPPAWNPDRRPVGPGPNNPLGDRWIGLSLNRTGIHGTNDPLNVGNSVTHGCMRTYPALVRELYDLVQVGWPVRIDYEVAKLGKTPDGRIYVATFPDVYRKMNPVATANQKLTRLGLKNRIKRDNLQDVLGLGLGFPVSIDGKETVSKEVARVVNWTATANDFDN
jgi:L,D-transpeptidase ErfK/SrfK